MSHLLGDSVGFVVIGLLASGIALVLFIALRRRPEIYPAREDETSQSVFDDQLERVILPERIILSDDTSRVDLGSLDAWQPNDRVNDRGSPGAGGSFGGGGASGKW
jgi:uncharacterized membrane protein YgcG